MSSTLIFEGAGWDKAPSPSSDIGNWRIRTRLKNEDGIVIYLEINGFEGSKYAPRPFPFTGYVAHCLSEDSDWRKLENEHFPYTSEALLNWVNTKLNCSFSALRVVNDGSVLVHETNDPLC